jgi:hypothetical protein
MLAPSKARSHGRNPIGKVSIVRESGELSVLASETIGLVAASNETAKAVRS